MSYRGSPSKVSRGSCQVREIRSIHGSRSKVSSENCVSTNNSAISVPIKSMGRAGDRRWRNGRGRMVLKELGGTERAGD
ncbi:hypothetical protein BJX64DRAFT_270632 [Aspergillus heterothallicus]